MNITIRPLTPDLLNDYLFFFDNMVFTENPDWSKCYCYSFHFTGTREQWNKKANRAAVAQLINAGKMRGYLAYSDNTPVGWCNANDRDNYQRLKTIYDLDGDPGDKICSVVCFLIHPNYRGKGIAKMLLDIVIDEYSGKAYDYLEAYPMKTGSSCEKNYKGPLSLYEKSNFRKVKEQDHYFIVRRAL